MPSAGVKYARLTICVQGQSEDFLKAFPQIKCLKKHSHNTRDVKDALKILSKLTLCFLKRKTDFFIFLLSVKLFLKRNPSLLFIDSV